MGFSNFNGRADCILLRMSKTSMHKIMYRRIILNAAIPHKTTMWSRPNTFYHSIRGMKCDSKQQKSKSYIADIGDIENGI